MIRNELYSTVVHISPRLLNIHSIKVAYIELLNSLVCCSFGNILILNFRWFHETWPLGLRVRPKTDSKARQEEEQKAKHDLKIFLSDPSPIIWNACH